jgi:predicted transcriptional regulator
MSTQVTLTLPDEVYRRAERLAQLSSRDVADVLADTTPLIPSD